MSVVVPVAVLVSESLVLVVLVLSVEYVEQDALLLDNDIVLVLSTRPDFLVFRSL